MRTIAYTLSLIPLLACMACGVGPGVTSRTGCTWMGGALASSQEHQSTDVAQASSAIVYSAGFGSGAGPEWSARTTESTPIGARAFLGQFGNESVSLSLNSLPLHTQVTISFDLFIIRSWDGNNGYYGPDVWELNTDAGANLMRTTFSNCAIPDCNQAFADSYPGGDHPAYNGATESKTLGYYCEAEAYGIHDAVYHICVTVPDSRGSIRFIFRKLQGGEGGNLSEESWGLDNVNVRTTTPTVTSYETGFFSADSGVWDSWQPKCTYGLGWQCFGLRWSGTDFPEDSLAPLRYQRPDGSSANDTSATWRHPYWASYSAFSWWWMYLDVPGEWHLLLDINGQRMVTAPFTVVNNWSPWMRNVTARQRINQPGVVDIDYDATDPDTSLLDVSLLLSSDGGAHYSIHPISVSGDIGPGVHQGTRRHIVWSAKTDSPSASGSYIARVSANDGTSDVWAYSQPFAVDTAALPPDPVPSVAASPYPSESGTTLLRGQLHAHRMSDWSSHSISSDDLARLYIGQGYDFLAQTEHHFKPGYTFGGMSPESVLGSWQGWAPNSTELTYGSLTHWPGWDTHVLAIGTSQGTTASDLHYHTGDTVNDTIQRVKNIHNHSGLAYVAHPDSDPYNIGAKDLVEVYRGSRMDGIGVYTPPHGHSQNTWDRVIYATGKPVWGCVEDDYHPDFMSKRNLGRTWVAVPGSPGEWWGTIKEKLRSGSYYCYYTTDGKWPGGTTPPQMRVTVSNSGSQPLVSVNFDRAVNSIEFYGYNWGFFKKLKSPVSGSSDSYQATGHEKFVRVMARYQFGGGTLWMTSQPIVINKNGNYSPYESNGARVMSTSPELILTYVDADNKPLAPPSGYVGDVFDVTTANGQLPPGATLQLSYAEEDIAPLGGTRYLAIYRYRDQPGEWVKVGGTVDPGTATIEAEITELGKYCISADLPDDTTAPEAWVDNPPYGASVPVDTTVKATVNDELGAWRVKFYMNGHLLCEDADSSDGWGADLKVSDYCTGDWTLKAEAEDLAGNTGTAETPIYVSSTTPRPTVSITSHPAGSVLSATATISGTCWDDVSVAAVMLYADDTLIGYADLDGAGGWSAGVDTTYLADSNRTLKAIVEDYPGNSATATLPVVISNNAATSPIGQIKGASDGSTARFAGAIVVADPSLAGNGFYAESSDRTSGVRIITDRSVSVGDSVSVVGTVATINSEKTVQASDVFVVSSGNATPKPLAIRGKQLSQPPDAIGKIVRVWGALNQIDPAAPARWFTVTDPSGVEITCKLAGGVTFDPSKAFVVVTGVVAVDAATRVLLVRLSEDILGF